MGSRTAREPNIPNSDHLYTVQAIGALGDEKQADQLVYNHGLGSARNLDEAKSIKSDLGAWVPTTNVTKLDNAIGMSAPARHHCG